MSHAERESMQKALPEAEPQPIDFDSDELLPICPLRPEGGEPCEACQ
jgi:hypothetical protein